ncbi:MAG: cellulase family glycosylhydrolase, partial [Acidobacteriaceae bacterium]|nr:cellulase family glycosylhydrolase [Acidobacteriaceae bacterium]
MTRLFSTILIAGLLGSMSPAAQNAAATKDETSVRSHLPLRTDGSWIVDRTGKRFKLRSVNWYGAEEQDHVVAGLELEKLSLIVQRIKAMGFNSVRLLWSNELFEMNPIVPDYAIRGNPEFRGMRAMRVFDAVVHAIADAGLLIVLDNHTSNGDWCCGNNDGNGLWYNQDYPEQNWISDWMHIVARYRDVPEVVGADLRNELRAGATWGGAPSTDWHAAAERGGNAVLSANRNLLIFVEGINYALDLTGVARLRVQLGVPNRLVYSAHDYPWDHNGITTEQQLFAQLDQKWGFVTAPGQPYTAPIWIGEFGTCHDQPSCLTSSSPGTNGFWFQGFRDYLDRRDFDWAYWALNGTQARGTGRTFGYEESYGVLDPYWNAPALPLVIPPPSVNLLTMLQTVMQPLQGPGAGRLNLAPVVSIIAPPPGSIFAAGSNVAISANASRRAGLIQKVDFYANGESIGSSITAPFQIEWTNVPPGNFEITAVATGSGDTVGSTTGISAPVRVMVFDYENYAPGTGNSIAIDFGNYRTTPMSLTEMAGVVPQQNWNGAYGNSGSLGSLVDKSGSTTGAQVTWAASNMWYTSTPDQPGDFRMMRGYLDNTNTSPTIVTVSQLPNAFAHYDVYVYFDGGNGTVERLGNYRILTSQDAS